ncbi:MAG: hypothetical protein M0R66_01040 [Candidatus Omnitrophica bacterium]|nr:hypothetical protein [Candidatus Omnitrophota bacterium]
MRGFNLFLKYGRALLLFLVLFSVIGCMTIRPTAPTLTSEICKDVAAKNIDDFPRSVGAQLLYKDDKNVLIGVNDYGFDNNGGYGAHFYNFWLYLSDINGENYHLVTKEPKNAPTLYEGSYLLRKAYIYKDKIFVEYNILPYVNPDDDTARGYYTINKDGTDQERIDINEFYRYSMDIYLPPRADFIKELASALANKEYEKAEDLRLYRLGKINWYIDKYVYNASEFSGETKIKYAMLLKEKEKLENIFGLSDPVLFQLREKYIAAINNEKYDDATKIFDLIERMEKKYKPEPAQDTPQVVQVMPEEQSQMPQKIIVEHQEAPSVGKQMRSLSTMAAGLDGGMTPKAQNAWMSLIGFGDFVDASNKK